MTDKAAAAEATPITDACLFDQDRRVSLSEQSIRLLECSRTLERESARLRGEVESNSLDAERWRVLCNLWAASTTLELTQEDNGFWGIKQIEPSEEITFRPLFGNDPDDTIAPALSAKPGAGEGERDA